MGKLIEVDWKNVEDNEKNITMTDEFGNMIEEYTLPDEQSSVRKYKIIDKNGKKLNFHKRIEFINNFFETKSFDIIDNDDIRMLILSEFPKETVNIIKEKYLNDSTFRLWLSLYSDENKARFERVFDWMRREIEVRIVEK